MQKQNRVNIIQIKTRFAKKTGFAETVSKPISQKIKKTLIAALFLLFLILPATVNAASLCDDIAGKTKGFFSCGQETTTFTEFQGGLTAPEAGGYSKGLTQTTNVRDYIKNIVNFALGFLGILAVVIIIYGGFLYVTAAGNDEKAGKGKKAVTYAITGLLIIMGSFAIVNTVLQAPTGKEGGQLNGSAPGSGTGGAGGTAADQNARRRQLFNFAASAVQTVTRDFVTAYQNYSEVMASLKNEEEFAVVLDTVGKFKTFEELKLFLSETKTQLASIQSKAGGLSQTAEKTIQAVAEVDKYLRIRNEDLQEVASGKQKWSQFWDTPKHNELRDVIAKIRKNLTQANGKDFALAVQNAFTKLADLRKRVKQSAPLPDVDLQFEIALKDFKKLVSGLPEVEPGLSWLIRAALAATPADMLAINGAPDNATILAIVQNLSKLYDLVKDIQFVYSVINADVVEGNAPLVVNFDGLKSLDPNNKTIPEANFKWDFGDGASDAKHVTTAHIYDKAGTYVVKLEIKSPDSAPGEPKAADGVAFRTITVKPPASRINLKVSTEETPSKEKPFILSEYNKDGFQIVNIADITFTTNEAKNGIYFDATETKTGGGTLLSGLSGKPNVKIKWDFGDKSKKDNTREGAADLLGQKVKFVYDKEGTYRVTLEVTDDRSITDRKIFNILVSSIAARIRVSPGTAVDKNAKVSVDGSASSTDIGAIKSYKWTFNKLPFEDFVIPPETVDHFDINRFKSPGLYEISLEVANNSNQTAKISTNLTVSAKPPVAQFTALNKDKTHPNVFVLDGSGSYTADAFTDEKLEYKWEISAAPGDCGYFTAQTDGKSFAENSKDCIELNKEGDKGFSSQNKKLKVKLKKGKYTITLVARNPDDPTGIKGGKTHEQQLVVEQDLDVGWGDDGKPLTTKLNERGRAEVSFVIKSETGVAYELDTGDGQKESGKMSTDTTVSTVVKHTYDKSGAYMVKLSVFDAQDNSNSVTRKVFVGDGKRPVAAIHVIQDGSDISDEIGVISGNRKSVFIFDAGKSLNVDGSARRLSYSWDLGDSEKSAKKQVTHIFKNANLKQNDSYTVKLKVTNEEDPTQFAEDSVKIKIKMEPPVIRSLTAIPNDQKLITPVNVIVTAIGAEDPDGKIVTYRWWYYDVNNPDNAMGLQITQAPTTTLIIGTNGEEGQKKSYKFGVIATDNDNLVFDTGKDLNEGVLPVIEVANGPNKSPVAKFSVDRTTIDVGESINFSSSSFDPDPSGSITKYIWDFEGKGFAFASLNDEYNKANVTYTFTKAAKNGHKVKLKVIDSAGAESVSDAVIIYVEGKTGSAPVAAFTSKQVDTGKQAQFTDNSTADSANNASIKKWTWDFDVNSDSDGDGVKDNDKNSTEQNPKYEYSDFGIYRAKLTVEDDQQNIAHVTNFVNVRAQEVKPAQTRIPDTVGEKKPAAPVVVKSLTSETKPVVTDAGGGLKPSFGAIKPAATQETNNKSSSVTAGEKLEARLLSVPPASETDGRIHLQGNDASVIFNFGTSKGDIKQYIIDKNIFFDANGNGLKDDDEDYKTTLSGIWTTQYSRSYGAIRARLTVIDSQGKKSTVDKDIVFDAPQPAPGKKLKNPLQLQTFLLSGYGVVDWPVLLVSILGFAIFVLSILYAKRKSTD